MIVEDILFRGKRKDNGEWVYGCLTVDLVMSNVSDINTSIRKAYCIKEIPQDYTHSYSWVEVDPETVGQFVGICDYDGEKLFTDDLVEYVERHRFGPFCERDGVAMVVDNTTLKDGIGHYWRPQDTQVLALIGNKYDNHDIYNKMKEDALEKWADRMARGLRELIDERR